MSKKNLAESKSNISKGAASEPNLTESLCSKNFQQSTSFPWYPTVNNIKQIEYVRKLECEYEKLQVAFLNLTAQLARLQFRLRQLMTAQPMEHSKLMKDIERIAFQQVDSFSQCKPEELPRIEKDNARLGDLKSKQTLMVCQLRNLCTDMLLDSECLLTEYRSDREYEKNQEKVCPPDIMTGRPSAFSKPATKPA